MQHRKYFVSEDNIVNETSGKPISFLNVRIADGSYVSPRTMQHVGRVIHGKEGIFDMVDPEWDFHMLRHTHASECIAAGMPPESLQKRLGHKNLTTTYKFYVHETEPQSDKARAILEEMYK
jgi:integrase